MKIFLTEFTFDNILYSGPNIIAKDWQTAELAALDNGLTVVGELTAMVVEKTAKKKYKDNIIPFPKDRVLH
mgnify:FL=1|jgi:hypothetical protein